MTSFRSWLEALAIKGNYKGGWFQKLVAAKYKLAPTIQQEAIPAFKDLEQKILRQQKFLQSKFDFKVTADDPYSSMAQMTKSINQQKASGIKPTVNVYGTQGDGHPIFSNDTNDVLRGVHDVMAHLYGQHPFSARGEYGAYSRHLKTLCNLDQVKSNGCLAAKALFTEIIGQTSYYYIYKNYPQQKAVILDDFDHWKVGALNANSPLNKYFVLENKDLIPRPNGMEQLAREIPDLYQELSSQ